MANGDIASYQLHIDTLHRIAWKEQRPPNLYVKVRFEESVQRTKVVRHNLTPTWDEKFALLGSRSSMLHLSVKHASYLRNSCVGEVEIDVSSLLGMCKDNQFANLELKVVDATVGSIIIRLSAVDSVLAGAIVAANARQDIEHKHILGLRSVAVPQSRPMVSNVYSKFLQPLQNVISKLYVFIDIVDKTSKVHPYAGFAWQVLSSLLKAVQDQMDRDQQVVSLLETMESVYSFVDAIQSLPNKLRLLENVISQILRQTVECGIFIREYTGRGFAGRAVVQAVIDPSQTIQDLTNNLKTLKQHFDSGITLQTAFVSSKTFKAVEKLDVELHELISVLPPVEIENLKRLNPARMDGFSRAECLPETRQEILKWVTDWLTTPSTSSNTLWLYGLAGSGKSTISTTIAEYFRELNRLGAFLFFDRNDPTNSQPAIVIRTLSYKLASFNASIQAAICESIARDPGFTEASMRVQFSKLLLEPIGSLTGLHEQGPVVIILDALDECGDSVSRKDLLTLLARELANFPPCFRFLITSRREPDIEGTFSRCDNIVARELDIMDQSNDEDIRSYIRHHTSELRTKFRLSPYWPGEAKIEALMRSSAGLFIWASTAVKFIEEEPNPEQQLDILLQPRPREVESTLDVLYGTALKVASKWNNDGVAADFRAVLGIIVVGRVPLSDITIDKILGLDGLRSSQYILKRLRCLFHWAPGQDARVLHASFPDYLADARRCKGLPWSIDISFHHHNLALACLRIMKEGLRFNICELETSHVSNDCVSALSDRIDSNIPAWLRYACCFWANHLQESDFDPGLLSMLEEFLHVRLLYWLEVLSLIEKVELASQALAIAAKWAKAHDEDVAAFAIDADLFVSTFRPAISRSAPHIYVSAVPLSPTNSLVSKQYLPQIPRRLSVEIGSISDWPINVNVLEGHTDEVVSVAFSPDGKHIVSGSRDGTVRVWEAETGRLPLKLLEGHTDGILSVGFSPDGKQIVSGSFDCTVRVWDAKTGNMAFMPFEGHTDAVKSVMFSPDGKKVVSGSADQTIRVWNVETGQLLLSPFKGHRGLVNSVAFSPDGKQIASGSKDMTVLVWDAETGMPSEPFKGHKGQIYSVDFSPDGKQIVSGSSDNTILVWHTETGNVSRPFVGHTDLVAGVKFSPDGKSLISGSHDNTILVWDVKTVEVVSGPFEGHTGLVWSVAVSPDGKRIVSGSLDHTIRLWGEGERSPFPAPFEGHIGVVWSVAFSPDGRQIASGSADGTLRLWDETGIPKTTFKSQSGPIYDIAFSLDGKRIVSGSDNIVQVWDVETGKAELILEGHTDSVWSVALSPDSKFIVSGSADKRARLWDAETGNVLLESFEARTGGITSVAFSPDGKRVGLGFQDRNVRVWDAKTGEVVLVLEGHTDEVSFVAFSLDGNRIVSSSDDGTNRLWDARTGRVILVLEGHSHWATSAKFSSDGKKIVSCSQDQTIRVWDSDTGEVALILEGHTDGVVTVTFSPDGKKVVSGSHDQTIRVWDVEMGSAPKGIVQGHAEVVGSFPLSVDGQHSVAHIDDSPTLENGWMQGNSEDSELLFWVPHYHRSGLWRPRNTAVIGRRVTKLNFSQFVHGLSWTQALTG